MAQPQQMHSHGPGQPMHTHTPPQPPPQVVPTPDPAIQALIDADYRPVDLTVGGPSESQVFCAKHKLEKCSDCDVDFTTTNRIAKLLTSQPNLRCPPPAQIVTPKLSQVITTTKEEGNLLYKNNQYDKAITKYTLAASYALQRPPWEASQLVRDELTTAISNRSAAYLELGDRIGALVDAETVIQLKRPWSKGHFRKAKALVEMGELKEAKDAISLGLQFEPNNTEMNGYLAEINGMIKKAEDTKATANSSASPRKP